MGQTGRDLGLLLTARLPTIATYPSLRSLAGAAGNEADSTDLVASFAFCNEVFGHLAAKSWRRPASRSAGEQA